MSGGGRVLEVCRRFNLSGQGPVYHSTMSLGEIHCNSSNLAAKCLCFVANKALSIRHFCERGDALLSANSSPGIGRKKHKSFEPRRTRRALRKRKALLCALRVLRGSLLFRAFCDSLRRRDDKWDGSRSHLPQPRRQKLTSRDKSLTLQEYRR